MSLRGLFSNKDGLAANILPSCPQPQPRPDIGPALSWSLDKGPQIILKHHQGTLLYHRKEIVIIGCHCNGRKCIGFQWPDRDACLSKGFNDRY